MIWASFSQFVEIVCAHMLRNTNGALYICMSSSELHTLRNAFTKAGGHWSTFIIWARMPSRWAGQIISGSLSRSSMAGGMEIRTTGVAPATKAIVAD